MVDPVRLEKIGDCESACVWSMIEGWRPEYRPLLMTLKEDFFFGPHEKAALSAIQRCLKKHGTVEPELMAEFGIEIPEEELVEDREFVRDAGVFGRSVIQKYTDRMTRQALEEAFKAVGTTDAIKLLIDTQDQLRDIGEFGQGERLGPNMVKAVKEHIEQLDKEARGESSIKWPWPSLDAVTQGGARNGALIVMGARPGAGKTTFAVQSALWAAGHKHNVVFASYEIPKRDVVRFAASCYSRQCVTDQHEDYLRAACTLQNFPITILDTEDHPFRTAEQLYEDCRALKRRGQCDILYVDHMHVLPSRERDEYKRLQHNARVLLNMALELDIPVVLLSQLSRDIEKRDNKTPRLSDLRGCGDIEQNASLIMFLDKPSTWRAVPPNQKDHCQIVIKKNRWGSNGKVVPLLHRGEHYRFEERMEFE